MYKKVLKAGDKFGSKTIVELCEERRNGYLVYKILCDCGDVSYVTGTYLRSRDSGLCRRCSLKKNNKKGKNHYAYKHGMSSRTNGKKTTRRQILNKCESKLKM